MHWRMEVIENVFGQTPSKRLLAATRRYYRQNIADGLCIAVVAEMDDTGAGCGAICLAEELPTPDNPSGKCAYLTNIYVRKEYRRRGVGHAIVRWLVDKARQSGCDRIYLEAADGHSGIGFTELTGIMKYADPHNSESEGSVGQ